MTLIDPAKLNTAHRLQANVVTPAATARAADSAAPRTADAAPARAPGLTAGAEAPVDSDRVLQIRKAIEEGRYPLIPSKIADAMIAAGHLLRAPR